MQHSLKSRPRDQLHSLTNYMTKWQQYTDKNGALRQNKGANRDAFIQAGQSVRPDYYRRRIQRDLPRGISLERKRFRVRVFEAATNTGTEDSKDCVRGEKM